ncbi:MAG TPA: hypothetical protein VNS79_15050 [Sphingobium sp.]|nr:hypothetical protein [Sphingobium sp.]
MSAMIFGFAMPASTSALAQKDPEPVCQRACLEKWVDDYLVAMRDGKVDPKLFARDLKFTENGVQLPFGNEGLWLTMSGLGKYKFYVPDIETQQVAFIGTVLEEASASAAGGPAKERLVAVALRLKIADNKITQIEQLAIRPDNTNSSGNGDGPAWPPVGEAVEAMGAPHPMFREAIPQGERASREELVKTANYYFTGLQRNDGKGYYPFTDDCDRFENGMDTLANVLDPDTGKRGRMTCKKQFETSYKGIVSRIRDRRFVAVDRERGIAFAFVAFDHNKISWTWQMAELFKIEKGQIRRIEAVFHRAPYGMGSGWGTYEQDISEEIQSIR